MVEILHTTIQRCTYVRVIQYCNNTAFCHANHFQDDIVMVVANLLKLLISFFDFRQEYNRRFEEKHDNIISESCFHCILLAAICNHYGTLHSIVPKSFHLFKCQIKPQFPHHSIVALVCHQNNVVKCWKRDHPWIHWWVQGLKPPHKQVCKPDSNSKLT